MTEEKKENRFKDIDNYIYLAIYLIPMAFIIVGVTRNLINPIIATILMIISVIQMIAFFRNAMDIYNLKRLIGGLYDKRNKRKESR